MRSKERCRKTQGQGRQSKDNSTALQPSEEHNRVHESEKDHDCLPRRKDPQGSGGRAKSLSEERDQWVCESDHENTRGDS